ncbi:MAG: copper chaperone PCu(A)C [Chakrabartia sp.]
MRIALALLPVALTLAACAPKSEAPITDAQVRLPAVDGNPGAAYFTLHGGAKGRTLVRIQGADIGRAEMHDMAMSDGMMKMVPLTQGVAAPAGGEVSFASGGKHVMLFDMKSGLKPGDPIRLDFAFADGSTYEVTAKAEAPGGSDTHDH